MRRTNLTDATMQGWERLDDTERLQFFERFLEAAQRLDPLALRAWLRRRVREPPLATPLDLSTLSLSEADMALLSEGYEEQRYSG